MIMTRKRLILGIILVLTMLNWAIPIKADNTTISTTTSTIGFNETGQFCLNNGTLLIKKAIPYAYHGIIVDGISQETKICPYGCDFVAQDCKNDPFILGIVGILALIGLFGAIWWASKRF